MSEVHTLALISGDGVTILGSGVVQRSFCSRAGDTTRSTTAFGRSLAP